MRSLNYYIYLATIGLVLLTETVNAHSADTDTVPKSNMNTMDANGLRQGYWKLTGEIAKDQSYRKDQLMEEGAYADNKRNGLWKKYYPTGTLRSEINYENNHPRGYYKTYYETGTLEESGDWQGNRNVGDFKRYHRNGELAQEFFFTEFGKRHGTQRYYHPNGQLQMSVEVEDGTAHGMLLVYYSNSELKSKKRLINGSVEEGSERTYKPQAKISDKYPEPDLPREETMPSKSDRPNLEEFKSTGFNTLYNRNQQITQVGDFNEGRLWNGKWHRYDGDGILRKVEVYSEGRFVGYGIIDDSSK
jgi:antitoxin component YwqK of YwqJK toxin-antitoxin module